MLNELLILTKIKAGDIKAFEELFRCYYSPLCWYAASITGRLITAVTITTSIIVLILIMPETNSIPPPDNTLSS